MWGVLWGSYGFHRREPLTPLTPLRALQARCNICWDEFKTVNPTLGASGAAPANACYSAACGHLFCASCWRGFVTASLESAAKATDMRCPMHPRCYAAVPRALVTALATSAQNARLSDLEATLIVNDNPRVAWCIKPDCPVVSVCIGDPPDRDECAPPPPFGPALSPWAQACRADGAPSAL